MAERERAGAAILRGGYYPPPWASGRYSDQRGSTIGELLGQRGQAQADYHMRSSAMLGDAVAQAGREVGNYFSAREEKKEMAKREAATLAAIESWDGQDPMSLFGSLQKVRGPGGDALGYTNTVLALRKGPQKDPEAELGRFGKTAQFLEGLDDATLTKVWPVIRQSLGPTAERLGMAGQDGQVPEQWDPSFRPLIAKAGEVFGPKREKGKLTAYRPGDVVVNEAGEVVHRIPEKPAAAKTVETVDAKGRPITKAVTDEELAAGVPKYVPPQAPRAPRDERLVQADVNGVATWMTESEARGKPAAQTARGATGAERGALAFYNRGRQALEDIAPLEDKVAKYGFLDQRALAYDGPGENYVKSDEQQRYRQAQRAFTEARLRKESGAAIPKEEYANDARTYFAQPNDGPEVLAQKKAAREKVLQGMGLSSGKAYQEYYGEPMPTPARGGQAPAAGGQPVRVQSVDEARKLPSGTLFIDPSGKTRRVP